MAFVTSITNERGRLFSQAYVRAQLARCDKDRCIVVCEVWESDSSRQQYPMNPDSIFTRIYPTDLNISNSNPIQYAYALLENSGEFPDATWNQ